MKATAVKYGGVQERLSHQMSRIQALRLKTLAEEAYQPAQFQPGISAAEAERRITALKAEIELAKFLLGQARQETLRPQHTVSQPPNEHQ